jgi:hypothetical protein
MPFHDEAVLEHITIGCERVAIGIFVNIPVSPVCNSTTPQRVEVSSTFSALSVEILFTGEPAFIRAVGPTICVALMFFKLLTTYWAGEYLPRYFSLIVPVPVCTIF